MGCYLGCGLFLPHALALGQCVEWSNAYRRLCPPRPSSFHCHRHSGRCTHLCRCLVVGDTEATPSRNGAIPCSFCLALASFPTHPLVPIDFCPHRLELHPPPQYGAFHRLWTAMDTHLGPFASSSIIKLSSSNIIFHTHTPHMAVHPCLLQAASFGLLDTRLGRFRCLCSGT